VFGSPDAFNINTADDAKASALKGRQHSAQWSIAIRIDFKFGNSKSEFFHKVQDKALAGLPHSNAVRSDHLAPAVQQNAFRSQSFFINPKGNKIDFFANVSLYLLANKFRTQNCPLVKFASLSNHAQPQLAPAKAPAQKRSPPKRCSLETDERIRVR
jgi:hypothetical protein